MKHLVYTLLTLFTITIQCSAEELNGTTAQKPDLNILRRYNLASPNISLATMTNGSVTVRTFNLKRDKGSFVNSVGETVSSQVFVINHDDYDQMLSVCLKLLRDNNEYTLDTEEEFVVVSLLFWDEEKAKQIHDIRKARTTINFEASSHSKRLRVLMGECLESR